MNQRKVKALRKAINESNKNAYVEYTYEPSNPDMAALIKSVGIERVVQARGTAPLSCMMVEGCKRLELKRAKRAL